MHSSLHRILVLVVLATAVVSVQAQRQQVFAGPSILAKAGVNAGEIPNGFKTGVNFNGLPDLGVTLKFMFSKETSIGMIADLEYATYSYQMKPNDGANDNNTLITQAQYISFAPSLYLSGLTLGAAFGFPSALATKFVSGTEVPNVGADDLTSPSIELRIGGMIPVMTADIGQLNIVLRGGYMVTGMDSESDEFSPKVASGALGINFLFDLGALTE
jgi:hypothetical protein